MHFATLITLIFLIPVLTCPRLIHDAVFSNYIFIYISILFKWPLGLTFNFATTNQYPISKNSGCIRRRWSQWDLSWWDFHQWPWRKDLFNYLTAIFRMIAMALVSYGQRTLYLLSQSYNYSRTCFAMPNAFIVVLIFTWTVSRIHFSQIKAD